MEQKVIDLQQKLAALQGTLEQTRTQRDLLKVTAANAIIDRDKAQTEYAALNEDFMKCREGNAYLVKQITGACRQVVKLMRDNLSLITECQDKALTIHGLEDQSAEWEKRAHAAESLITGICVSPKDFIDWCKEETKCLIPRDKEFFYLGAGNLYNHFQTIRVKNEDSFNWMMAEMDSVQTKVRALISERDRLLKDANEVIEQLGKDKQKLIAHNGELQHYIHQQH